MLTKKNKNAVSEIISYVILIVIVLSISSTVYFWMSANIPVIEEKCPEDVSLLINDYSCSNQCSSGGGEVTSCITLKLKNNGYFNISGFFIRASNDARDIPTSGLTCDTFESCFETSFKEDGRFNFNMLGEEYPALSPQQEVEITFNYPEKRPLIKIQIEPFIADKTLKICKDATITLNIESSKNCN